MVKKMKIKNLKKLNTTSLETIASYFNELQLSKISDSLKLWNRWNDENAPINQNLVESLIDSIRNARHELDEIESELEIINC